MVTCVPPVASPSICFFSRISGSFFLVSIWTSKKCAGVRALVREMIWTGLPVVSWPYMPAAEMPRPACPRRIRHAAHAAPLGADRRLPTAHAKPMELGAVWELGEDRRDLLPDDSGAVVRHGD